MHAGERRRRADRDDVRDGPPVRDRRRRRALEGIRGRAGRAARSPPPTPRRSPSPSSPARRAATRRPPKLHDAVKKAGGQIAAEINVKAWDLPEVARSSRPQALELDLDKDGAKALVAQVGERQQRLLRELEKLALEHGPGAPIGAEEVEESCATSRRAQGLDARRRARRGRPADVARAAARAAPAGRARHRADLQHGPPPARRGRGRRGSSQAGQSPAQVKKTLRMPPRAADKFVKDVAARDVEAPAPRARRDGRPRGRDPRRRRRRAQRGHGGRPRGARRRSLT